MNGSYKIGNAPLTPWPARFQLKSESQEKSSKILISWQEGKNGFVYSSQKKAHGEMWTLSVNRKILFLSLEDTFRAITKLDVPK